MIWKYGTVTIFLLAAIGLYGQARQGVFVGVITDTMCGVNHKMMGNLPSDECTVQCVKSNPKDIKYALVEGENVHVLSNQQTPEKFAGHKVKVTGTLNAKTKIIEVKKIEPVQ